MTPNDPQVLVKLYFHPIPTYVNEGKPLMGKNIVSFFYSMIPILKNDFMIVRSRD